MTAPKVLFYDVETSLVEAATFNLWNTNISYKYLRADWWMFCASWRWQGQKRIHSVSLLDLPSLFKKDYSDDFYVISALYDVLSQADAVVAHNGDSFDIKKFNARAIYHGFDPLPSIVQIDTLKMAKQKFKFTYNNLDYIAQYLGVGKKIKTDGDLWIRCLDGDVKALKEMVRYNKMDVVVLEAVYDKLSPWCVSKLNRNLFTSDRVCPSCGGSHLTRHKQRITRTGKQIQMQCQDCGHYSSYPEGLKHPGIIR